MKRIALVAPLVLVFLGNTLYTQNPARTPQDVYSNVGFLVKAAHKKSGEPDVSELLAQEALILAEKDLPAGAVDRIVAEALSTRGDGRFDVSLDKKILSMRNLWLAKHDKELHSAISELQNRIALSEQKAQILQLQIDGLKLQMEELTKIAKPKTTPRSQ